MAAFLPEVNAVKYGHIPGVDKPISRLILGTVMFSPDAMGFAETMLDRFVALGGNALDTAHSYGNGRCEQAVGQWLAGRKRDDVVLVSKGAHPEPADSGPRVTPAAIAADLAESLQRLQTDYIDLYLLHRDDPSRPVGEIVECLHAAAMEGRIRAYGGSNWTPARIEEANRYARAHGLRPFVASSPNVSLGLWNEPPWPGCLAAVGQDRQWYAEHAFPVLSWSSQAQGFFTGRYRPDDRTNADMVRAWYNDTNWARLARAEERAAAKGCTAAQIALAYVLCQPFPIFALIGPHTEDEMLSSFAALDVELTPDELSWLEGSG